MLDYLKLVENFDLLFFVPDDEHDNAMTVRGEQYLDLGEEIDKTSIGPSWTVMLFKYNEEDGNVMNLDRFDAVLSEPREYISSLIIDDWYGIIARRTTKSSQIIEELFDSLKELC
jgi:hypothetical protein